MRLKDESAWAPTVERVSMALVNATITRDEIRILAVCNLDEPVQVRPRMMVDGGGISQGHRL